MDSYYHVLYVIEPRPELVERWRGRIEQDFSTVLANAVSYHTQEKDDPNWSEADRLLNAKVIFLHALRNYDRLKRDAEFQASISTSAEATFDKWWTIRRFQATGEFGDLHSTLPYTESIALTGNPKVDENLRNLQKHKPYLGASVLFHSPGELQISPLIQGSWEQPPLEVLDSSGAAGGFGNDVFDSCSQFLAWCLSKHPPPARIGVFSIPGVSWPGSDADPYEWYDKVMTEVATWDDPPYLVDLDKFVITRRNEVLWPAGKRGQEQPKDPRAPRSGSPLLWAWYGIGLGDFRPCQVTYGCYSYEALPPISVRLDGTFQWLQAARSWGSSIGKPEETEAALVSLLVENPGLPSEFVKFFRSPDLWRKIRSCTGCYLNLDRAAVEIPTKVGRLVRFMSDYQDCIHWSLYLSPCGTKQCVVATYHFAGSQRGTKPHPRDTTACAESFEEFIYRFWLESELWFALPGGAMPQHGEQYLAHYRSAKT